MTSPDFSLLGGGNNALQMFDYGRKMGQELRERREAEQLKTAISGYASDPNNPNALAPVIAADPRLGMQLRGQQQQQAQHAQEQRRADLPLITRLVESSRDEASYQQNRATAQQYGIDVSTLPATFDPAWREQQIMTLKALQDPTKAEALSTAGKIATDQLGPDKVGTPEWRARVTEIWQTQESKPYVVGGETRLYTPRLGGPGQSVGASPQSGPQPGAVEDGFRFKGGNPADRSSWEPVAQGGQTARPSATFRGGFQGLTGETITSTKRSAAHNKAVGGVSNSYHLTGQARDSVPPRGMSMAAYASQLRRLNPDKDVINEGDHVHMEPRG